MLSTEADAAYAKAKELGYKAQLALFWGLMIYLYTLDRVSMKLDMYRLTTIDYDF
jgi:hypothetical protein